MEERLGSLIVPALVGAAGSHDSVVERGSAARSTILAAPGGKLKVKEAGSSLLGVLIGGGEIVIEKGALVTGS